MDYEFQDNINETRTKDELFWKQKHLKIIQYNYSRANYFKDFFPVFRELLLSTYANIADMNITINQFICTRFGLNPRFVRASELKLNSVKEERILDICSTLGATVYLSGVGAKAYQEEQHFMDRGIQLYYTDYSPVTYPQLWNDFIPNLSILDYIFNCGFDWDYIEKSQEHDKGCVKL